MIWYCMEKSPKLNLALGYHELEIYTVDKLKATINFFS